MASRSHCQTTRIAALVALIPDVDRRRTCRVDMPLAVLPPVLVLVRLTLQQQAMVELEVLLPHLMSVVIMAQERFGLTIGSLCSCSSMYQVVIIIMMLFAC